MSMTTAEFMQRAAIAAMVSAGTFEKAWEAAERLWEAAPQDWKDSMVAADDRFIHEAIVASEAAK